MIGVVPPVASIAETGDVYLRIHGLDVRIRSDIPAVLDTVATSYAAFRLVDPGAHSAKPASVIETQSAGAPDPAAAVLGTLDRVVMRVLDGLGERGILGTHAAAVSIGDRAIVLAGPSGAGKSTLTLALLREGARLLTDELTLIDRDGSTVHPYPRALHVSPSTVELLPELAFLRDRPRQALGADLEWAVSAADLAGAFGSTVAPPTRLGAIVLLDERGDPRDDPRMEPITAAQSALELARGTPAAARDFAGTIARLASIAGSVPTVRLRATDLRRTAAMLLDRLEVAR
jgi:hypothetical protein